MLPSGIPTPASVAFHPPDQLPTSSYDNPEFPSPNLYELSLLLHSEPGIEAFWSNLVKIATTCYKAERVTLAVPSDSTDLENTPWGQKATFNMADDDLMSLGYLGSSRGRPRSGTAGGASIMSEDEGVPIPKSEAESEAERRACSGTDDLDSESIDSVIIDDDSESLFSPVTVTASPLESAVRSTPESSEWCPMTGGKTTGSQHPVVSEVESAEDPDKAYRSNDTELKGRIFPTLQPLNYEPDALLDGTGVGRVLQRGKTVVLSREYRDVKTHLVDKVKRRKDEKSVATSTKTSPAKPSSAERLPPPSPGPSTTVGLEKIDLPTSPFMMPSQPNTPLFFVGKGVRRRRNHEGHSHLGHNPVLQYYSTQQHLHHVQSRGNSPQRSASYEEYEQAISSPWSQSPAPSPAPRQDPTENPFFAQPNIDEDTFNPRVASPVYNADELVSAIGCESSWTVIHIPLVHPSLSKGFAPTLPLNKPMYSDKPGPVDEHGRQQSKAPIAILSMLSPVIPYPNNLIHSLSNFAPFVATAYSLAQTHSALSGQLNHFRARPRKKRNNIPYMPPFFGINDSVESATSASDASTFAVSNLASPMTEQSPIPTHEDEGGGGGGGGGAQMPMSPGNTDLPDGYFSRGRSHIFSRQNSGNVATVDMFPKGVDPEQYTSLEARLHMPVHGAEFRADRSRSAGSYFPTPRRREGTVGQLQTPVKEPDPGDSSYETDEDATPTTAPEKGKRCKTRFVRRKKVGSSARVGRHTLLHSYGADYGATFQSLSAAPGRRRGSGSRSRYKLDMPPPSNKLLRTIVDSIPVHVFTAVPGTGAISWVNARMLAYRGFTSEQFMRNPWEAIHAEDREEYLRKWDVAIRRGEPFSHQMRVRRFDGQYRWFMVRAVPLRDQRGIIVHWFGTNMDIHDQRLAEVNAARQAEMAESESKYKSLANSSPQIVFAATANDGITFANTQWMSYSGQTFSQALNFGFLDYVHQDDREKCCLPPGEDGVCGSTSKCASRHSGSPGSSQGGFTTRKTDGIFSADNVDDEGGPQTYSAELRLKDKHGDFRWHLVRCVSVESSVDNKEQLWFGTCTDINKNKMVEQKLQEANDAARKTMESKTRFLANMSHEIRNFPFFGGK